MKAIILAGGRGERLRPLTLGLSKPMLPVMGRPVIERTIALLKEHNMTDVCITLCHQPQQVMDRLGDGAGLGVRLTYVLEEEPLGTAGSVKNCEAWLGGEDFLVISGNCLCDLDLGRLIRFHQQREAVATLALCRCAHPLRHSQAALRPDGRVEWFVDHPTWSQVVTDLADTGIYLLSPRALKGIPEGGAWEFGRDLIPGLLQAGAPVYGCALDGYWATFHDCPSYLEGLCGALSGKIKLPQELPLRAPGIWAHRPIPQGVSVVPPCWIGPEVELGAGCLIGPHVVLERGAWVGEKALVQRSVLLEGAGAGARSTLYGAILAPHAAARQGAVLHEGAVLGENALAEERSVLLEGVKLWPGQTAQAGCRLERSVTCGSQKGVLRLGENGVIRGVVGEDIGPEGLLTLGGVLGRKGRVGLGASGTPAAGMLARAAAAGISAAGGQAVTCSGLEAPVQWPWAVRKESLPVALFVEEQEDGLVYLHLLDGRGLPLNQADARHLEHALAQGEVGRVRSGRVTTPAELGLRPEQWAEEIARGARLGRPALRRVAVAVAGDTPENRALRGALLALGCRVEDGWRPGLPAFSAGHGGFSLTAQDEKGALLEGGQLLTLVSLIEMENGGGRVAIPADGSAAVDLVAAGYGGTVLRLDRDGGKARDLYAALPWLWCAPSAAVRICARMGVSGQKLESLMSKTPRFSVWRREVPLSAHRSQVMRALAGDRAWPEPGQGLRLRAGGGWVYLAPMARRHALRVVAEGPDLELAAELCDFYAARALQLDRELTEAKK